MKNLVWSVANCFSNGPNDLGGLVILVRFLADAHSETFEFYPGPCSAVLIASLQKGLEKDPIKDEFKGKSEEASKKNDNVWIEDQTLLHRALG